jgi:hypothetical protein
MTWAYAWEGQAAFSNRLRTLAPGQYELVEVHTRRGITRALLFPGDILRKEWEANAPCAKLSPSSASDCGRARGKNAPRSSFRKSIARQEFEPRSTTPILPCTVASLQSEGSFPDDGRVCRVRASDDSGTSPRWPQEGQERGKTARQASPYHRSLKNESVTL